uniref:SFRICE_028841 n=1 Tax=Spodoptera frugiperda TaxID=7108 RepID=A0A2H1VM68_SPOFR
MLEAHIHEQCSATPDASIVARYWVESSSSSKHYINSHVDPATDTGININLVLSTLQELRLTQIALKCIVQVKLSVVPTNVTYS